MIHSKPSEIDFHDQNGAAGGNDKKQVVPGRIPAGVYERLPDTLGNVATCLDAGFERDVFLTGALPVVAGALPNAGIRYGGHFHRLNLYTAVIGPPGVGKGTMKHARGLGTRLDRALWGQGRALFVPADSSGAAMKETLERSPHGVIFETELKTLANALGKGWGSFKDVLLKGFHNEEVKVRRKGKTPVHIRNPAPSIGVSGTPRVFRGVFSVRDGGLFSRFAFYWLSAEPAWENQFGSAESALNETKDQAAKRLMALRQRLEDRASPLDLKIKGPAQRMVNDTFDSITERWNQKGVRNELHSSLRRAGLRGVRIGALLRALRLFERGQNLSERDAAQVRREEVGIGLQIALTYLVHSVRIAERDGPGTGPNLTQTQREYLDALPTGQFETSEAKEIAPSVGVSERNAQRWLKRWSRKTGLIDKVKRGVWEKTQGERESGAIKAVADALAGVSGKNVSGEVPEQRGDGAPVHQNRN